MNYDDRVVSVFNTISRCANVTACYNGRGDNCRAIIQYQIKEHAAATYADFRVPEPWVGQIDRARILFVSSNPSIGRDDHACGSTSDEAIWDSHHYAFGGEGHPASILDGVYTVDGNGQRTKAVRYWSWARRRAMELIPTAVPGTDYAMTEVVHCKSTGEIGVAEVSATCVERHFSAVMSVAAAPVIIAVGAFAQRQIFGAPAPERPVEMDLGGRRRLVVGLTHPSGFGNGKTLAKRYAEEHLAQLRAWAQRSALA